MDLPESQHVYRYWVEIRDLRDGSVRELPLQALKRIHLATKKGTARLPDEVVLQLQDDSTVLEAKDIDDLAAQLRVRYPDETYERFLRRNATIEAERRKADALNGLIELLARAAIEDVRREQAGQAGD